MKNTIARIIAATRAVAKDTLRTGRFGYSAILISSALHLKSTLIGKNLDAGEVFQYTVRANTWFGSRVRVGGDFSLVGCSVSPGFDFKDFEMGEVEKLSKQFPNLKGIIYEMTRI